MASSAICSNRSLENLQGFWQPRRSSLDGILHMFLRLRPLFGLPNWKVAKWPLGRASVGSKSASAKTTKLVRNRLYIYYMERHCMAMQKRMQHVLSKPGRINLFCTRMQTRVLFSWNNLYPASTSRPWGQAVPNMFANFLNSHIKPDLGLEAKIRKVSKSRGPAWKSLSLRVPSVSEILSPSASSSKRMAKSSWPPAKLWQQFRLWQCDKCLALTN